MNAYILTERGHGQTPEIPIAVFLDKEETEYRKQKLENNPDNTFIRYWIQEVPFNPEAL